MHCLYFLKVISFFKATKSDKNQKSFSQVTKTVKEHTGNTFAKKLVLISKTKINKKSKSAICFTERTFIHEIENKNGLESEL